METNATGVLPDWMADLHPDAWTVPFWEAAKEHRLVGARCVQCGTFRMPPRPFCRVCRRQEIEWVDLPGTGTVFTYTVVRHAVVPELATHVPYVIAVVEVDGAPGTRLVAAVVESDPEEVRIGRKVAVRWDDVHENVTIPRFALADS